MTRCLEGIMAFCNAHLMMGHKNSLAFVVSHTEKRFVPFFSIYFTGAYLPLISLNLKCMGL